MEHILNTTFDIDVVSMSCRALLSVHRALLSVYGALLSVHRALLSVYGAHLSVHAALMSAYGTV